MGVPAKRVAIGERSYESEGGEVLLAVDDIRVEGIASGVLLDGLLTWLADDWARRYEDAPAFEKVDIGGRDVTAVTFGVDDPTEYILTSGDTAMRVRGSDEEAALTLLQALSCRHLDVYSLVTDYLVERMPPR